MTTTRKEDAMRAVRQRDWPEAQRLWELEMEHAPDDSEAVFRAAEALREQRKFDEADSLLEVGLERFPRSEWVAINYAWIAVYKGDWDEALSRWEHVLDRFPGHWVAMTGKGEALRELGRLDDAEAILGDAMIRFPKIEMPFVHHALVSARRGNWTEALERWSATRASFPDLAAAQIGIARALMELSRLDEAEEVLADALSRHPGDAVARGLEEALARRRKHTAQSAVQRVRQQIIESKIEEILPKAAANPEVLIEITSICNFACSYCVSPMKLREKKQMSLDTFREVIAQVAAVTTKPVRLHVDGEPTSHPQFREMAKLVNSHGLPVWLATNGSQLDPVFLDIWMDPLISMSTSPDELVKRHKKLDFEVYIARIARYARAWSVSQARQNLFFQIIHYPQANAEENARYRKAKNEFLVDFCRRAGLYETCVEHTGIDEPSYSLGRKGHPGGLTFIKQGITMGGLYPIDGKLLDRERATAGFCDSPWRMITVHSNGTLGACCSDLSGGTNFAAMQPAGGKSIKELWESSPQIQRLRQSFLEGRVEREVCQRCLKQEQVWMQAKSA